MTDRRTTLKVITSATVAVGGAAVTAPALGLVASTAQDHRPPEVHLPPGGWAVVARFEDLPLGRPVSANVVGAEVDAWSFAGGRRLGAVWLIRDGQEVKLSKRKGNILTIGEVVEEVGADAVRFNLLTRGPESTIDFDLDLAVEQNNENPVFYVQYSHARICSILDKAAEQGFAEPAGAPVALSLLEHPSELALMRKLLELEEQIELAVDKLSPHNLTHYALELARVFNGFYRDCRVVDETNQPLSAARLLLSRAAQIGLAKTLGLLGVTTPHIM